MNIRPEFFTIFCGSHGSNAYIWICQSNPARSLGATHGTLEAGKAADFAVWDIERPAELAYRLGFNPLAYAVKDGVIGGGVIGDD